LHKEPSAAMHVLTALGITQTFNGPPAVLKIVSIAVIGGGHKPISFAKPIGVRSCGVSAS
jgi:hypothetical protein